ncbi:MAG: hypothetical protein ACYSWR_00800 [Planctomycetota bacterium]|jgi:hypothetical protein
MDTVWLRGALFSGHASDAIKLGTVLTCGWFWMRVSGCSVLYRGSSMDTIEFENILAVAEVDASEMSPPDYVQHDSNSTYFYVIRRTNGCGNQEYTLSAAIKVSIDAWGNLAEPQPNNIVGVRVKQVDGNKVELVWYYCPLEQKQEPTCFRVYYDAGTGQVDYENPIITLCYRGRKYYSYQSDSLGTGRYLFCIRAEGANGAEGASSQVGIELDISSPDAVDILDAAGV